MHDDHACACVRPARNPPAVGDLPGGHRGAAAAGGASRRVPKYLATGLQAPRAGLTAKSPQFTVIDHLTAW